MERIANKKWREVEFEVNDWVYLKLRPYWQSLLARYAHPKLNPRFTRSYQITTRVKKAAYRTALPLDLGIHPIFHVSLLRKAVGSNLPVLPLPSNLAPDLTYALQSAEILGMQNSPTNEGVVEVLIRWENGLPIDATWELTTIIDEQFPKFHLKDKLALWGRVMIGLVLPKCMCISMWGNLLVSYVGPREYCLLREEGSWMKDYVSWWRGGRKSSFCIILFVILLYEI